MSIRTVANKSEGHAHFQLPGPSKDAMDGRLESNTLIGHEINEIPAKSSAVADKSEYSLPLGPSKHVATSHRMDLLAFHWFSIDLLELLHFRFFRSGLSNRMDL